MKKTIAVFLRVEGESKGELRFYEDEGMVARENLTIDGYYPRDIKLQNVKVDLECDLDEVMRIALTQMIEADMEKLKAKNWEAGALREGIAAFEQELAQLSKHQAA